MDAILLLLGQQPLMTLFLTVALCVVLYITFGRVRFDGR